MHLLGFPYRPFPFDLELLYGSRPEAFPLEALADFARLGAWLLSPHDPMRIEWAAKTAVARAVRDTFKGRNEEVLTDEEVEPYLARVQQAHFSLETVTFGLLRMPGLEYWDESHVELATRAETAIVIAGTLLQLDRHAPVGTRASMNRAVQQASFPSDFSNGVSRKTANEIWEIYGPCSAFLLCERWFTLPDIDEDTKSKLKEILFISPSRADFFYFFQLFREGGIIKEMLSNAKYLQEEISKVLLETRATAVTFAPFPDSIPPIELNVPQFSKIEVQRINNYRAEA